MRTFSGRRLIERYIVKAILPYVGLSLFLLTFVLLAQQAGRFVEILGSAEPSFEAIAGIALGLLPSILVFTLPMSVLIGTATGLSRLGSDSELIAMRAAGIGTWRIDSAVLLIGLSCTLLTIYIGFEVAPKATALMRQAASKVALSRLESPIQPHTFNTEIPGKVVYVRDGDKTQGHWGRVFIHWQDGGQDIRLVTARQGRLDITGDQTEMVLTDAVVTTLPSSPESAKNTPRQIVTESSAQLRVRLNTGRNALLKKLRERRIEFDELTWQEALDRVGSTTGPERRTLVISLHKKLALCCAPLAFALLGIGLGGRTRRVRRGQAVLMSLGAMLLYYLILLAGEQLSRNNTIPPQVGVWLATGATLVAGLTALFLSERGGSAWRFPSRLFPLKIESFQISRSRTHSSIFLGSLDRSIMRDLCLNFTVAYATLLLIFLIFTLFELLRFITNAEWHLVALYLVYLVPFASVNLAPISLLVAVLVTYALLAKRNEVIVWWASGQSLYRLAVPTLFLSLLLSIVLGIVQETVLPQANRRQENYRAQIRGGLNRATTAAGFQWLAVADTTRLYSYKYESSRRTLLNPVVYEFDSKGIHLKRMILSAEGRWKEFGVVEFEEADLLEVGQAEQGKFSRELRYSIDEKTPIESFKPLLNKPSELNSRDLSNYIKVLKKVKPEETAPLRVALYRRGTDLLAPLIVALIGVPFGVFFGKRSAFWALGAALLIGLLLWASASGFQQLGNYRLLPASIAAWATPLIFIALGVLLFSRART